MPEQLTPEVIAQTPDVTLADVTDQEALLVELASLSLIDYDRRRESAAKLLSIRVGTLDAEVAARRSKPEEETAGETLVAVPPAPWDDPVGGAELLADLDAWFHRYVVLPDGAADMLALWTVHTYAIDAAQITPRLAIVSPQKRCGKTTLMALVGAVTSKALAAANITAAALFRAIEQWRPTMLIDEADTFLQDNEELRGVLNAGHYRPGAYVVRAVPVGDSWEPRAFCVWGPVAIALIGSLPSTLADRSITVRLRRKTQAEQVERLRLDRLGNAEELRRRCLRWAQDHLPQLTACDPMVPETLNDRAADNWRPLCAIAEVAGGKWPQRVVQAITALASTEVDDDAAGVLLLEDIRQIFADQNTDKLASADLVEALHKLEERPWSEWGRQTKPITARQVARLLGPFSIKSHNVRIGAAVPKGYERDDFADAWSRYLSATLIPTQTATLSATALQASNGTRIQPSLSATPFHYASATALHASKGVDSGSAQPLHASNGTGVAETLTVQSVLMPNCSSVADRDGDHVADALGLPNASILGGSAVADRIPSSGETGVAESAFPPVQVPPCVLCGGTQRWNDHGVWRCVTCWPPGQQKASRIESVEV